MTICQNIDQDFTQLLWVGIRPIHVLHGRVGVHDNASERLVYLVRNGSSHLAEQSEPLQATDFFAALLGFFFRLFSICDIEHNSDHA